MGQRIQGIFSIEKKKRLIAINRELTMTLMRLIVIKYFNRLTALEKTFWRNSRVLEAGGGNAIQTLRGELRLW